MTGEKAEYMETSSEEGDSESENNDGGVQQKVKLRDLQKVISTGEKKGFLEQKYLC